MAEPVDQEPVPIGFEGLVEEPKDGQKAYTVTFSPSESDPNKPLNDEEDKPGYRTFAEGADVAAIPTGSEEIKLLEKGSSPSRDEKKLKEQTLLFDDGVRTIDFILTYVDQLEEPEPPKWRRKFCCCLNWEKKKEDSEEKREKRKIKREKFLQSCIELGLEYEVQDCSESPDRKTYFVKFHACHDCLLKGADDLLLRMPIEKNSLKKGSWREAFFDCIKVADPFQPKIPEGLEIQNYFTAPFKYSHKENFIDWEKDSFFSSAQRAAIVWNVMQNARYGKEGDQIGVQRLQANDSFGQAYPLHEGSHKVAKGEEPKTERQFLWRQWSYWRNWYKSQPLDHIRHYYGEKVGIYFTWLGFYTTWLLPASIIGFIVFLYGLSTIGLENNSVASDICRDRNRTDYFMCPLCDERCDFWWLRDTCNFARVALLFDNGATVFFAIVMAFWAVLFLEFWKRRQFKLQYDWDMLGYEDAEQRARPEFEQRIKRYIRRAKSEKAAKRFTIFNEVLNRKEYIQPASWFFPKLISSFTILAVMVLVAVGVVFSVLLYRLGIAGVIYRAVSGIPGGPSIGDIVVSLTGAVIQLIAIIILNRLYEVLALILNNWELHRTQTEYDDSFITKMYLFQFVNFYASIFYVAFFKGNFTGYPGGYERIGGLRLDECAAYGCLLELTIQLGIIMIGKQILNNVAELGVPYGKRLVKYFQHKDDTEEDVYTRWEKDFDLIALTQHGLFYEYLELVIQYGFVTIFVAAFPLAPLFALLNNWVEIRLDAHKFVTIFRRPVPERAQDIGAWYTILSVVSNLAVLTNGFLIAITAQFVPLELVYIKGDYRDDYEANLSQEFIDMFPLRRYSGYPTFSTSPFPVSALLDGQAFPFYEVIELEAYDDYGNQSFSMGTEEAIIQLPFINFTCLTAMGYDTDVCASMYVSSIEVNRTREEETLVGFTAEQFTSFFNTTMMGSTCGGRDLLFNVEEGVSPRPENVGVCADLTTQCRSRVLREVNGDRPLRYWQSFTARLGFIVIFEHFIFIISAILAWLVPDVPQSVQNEIQREKLLAYEAIHTRHAAKVSSTSPEPKPESLEQVEAL